tara:strand:+ start:294 stop:470 length:177 start_codon:yes stop_codon:yes gene_type:complete
MFKGLSDLLSQENLEQVIMKKQDLFLKWIMKFLPELPPLLIQAGNKKDHVGEISTFSS